MLKERAREDVLTLVDSLNFAQKVERSLDLINDAYQEHAIASSWQTALARTPWRSGTLPNESARQSAASS